MHHCSHGATVLMSYPLVVNQTLHWIYFLSERCILMKEMCVAIFMLEPIGSGSLNPSQFCTYHRRSFIRAKGDHCPPWICKFYTRWTVFWHGSLLYQKGAPPHSSIKLRHWYLCHQWATYMEGQVFFNWFDPISSLKSCRKRSTSRPLLPKAKVIWSCSIYVLMSESAKLYH